MIMNLVRSDHSSSSYPTVATLPGVFLESVKYSFDTPSDVFTIPRTKYIHSVGVVMPFKLVASSNKYTGMFRGADYGLLRFSSAASPSSTIDPLYGSMGGFTPGVGIKMFRDGKPSANFMAMPTLDAQACSIPNFFANTFTNHPGGAKKMSLAGLQLKLLSKKFWQASRCPHMVALSDVASYDQAGSSIASPMFPFEVKLKPAQGLNVEIPCDDYSGGLANMEQIPVGTKLFDIYAAESPTSSMEMIGSFVTTGTPTRSKWGDERLFFKHQYMEDDFKINPHWLKQFDVTSVCGMPCVGTRPPTASQGCSNPFNNPLSECPFKDLYN